MQYDLSAQFFVIFGFELKDISIFVVFSIFIYILKIVASSGSTVQPVTVAIQKVILERFCHSNPVPTKKVVLASCTNKIDFVIFSHQAHNRDALIQVPGREF